MDVELKTPDYLRSEVIDMAKENDIPVLIAYENFDGTPSKEELLDIYRQEVELGADIAKFAVIANDYDDMLTVLGTANEAKDVIDVPYVAIAMGDYGSITRPFALKLGASMTYCAPDRDKLGAPGQLTIEDTRTVLGMFK